MPPLGGVVCLDRIRISPAELFTNADGCGVLLADRVQRLFHAVRFCKQQSLPKDLRAVPFAPFGHAYRDSDAADVLQNAGRKLRAKLKLSDEPIAVDRPIMKASRLSFDRSTFPAAVPRFRACKPCFIDFVRIRRAKPNDAVIVQFPAVFPISVHIIRTAFYEPQHLPVSFFYAAQAHCTR